MSREKIEVHINEEGFWSVATVDGVEVARVRTSLLKDKAGFARFIGGQLMAQKLGSAADYNAKMIDSMGEIVRLAEEAMESAVFCVVVLQSAKGAGTVLSNIEKDQTVVDVLNIALSHAGEGKGDENNVH